MCCSVSKVSCQWEACDCTVHTPLHTPEVDKACAPSHTTNHFWLFFTRLTFPSRTTFSLQKISPVENRNIFITAYYQNVMISVQNILAGEFKSSEWTNQVAVISQCQFHGEICFGGVRRWWNWMPRRWRWWRIKKTFLHKPKSFYYVNIDIAIAVWNSY